MRTNFKDNLLLYAVCLTLAYVAPACSCGDDDDGNVTPDAAENIDAPDPNAFPTIGTQIDRSGRPAITTALVKSMIYTDDPDKLVGKDMYNAAASPANWATMFAAELTTHIAILDGVNSSLAVGGGSGCGTSFAFDATTFYAPLAGVLADDRLQIDTSEAMCIQYLAVESGTAGDCGGRTPLMDVVDVSYSALATGALSGVNDGFLAPTDRANTGSFPFLNEPIPGT